MSSGRVLISGAGIAGSVCAHWLAKHAHEVVVVERSRIDQKLGQGLEIEYPAIKVVKAMGLMDELEAAKTGEAGTILYDEHTGPYAKFSVDGVGPTGALELMRGDMAEIFYKSANQYPNVSYRYETTVTSLRQTANKVTADLEDRATKTTTSEDFDYVIGADGAKSRIRNLIFGDRPEYYHPVGSYVAYFSIPKQVHDWPYSRLCHFPNRRLLWLRPVSATSDTTSAYFIHTPATPLPDLAAANAAGDRPRQKALLSELFADLGWEVPRALAQMADARNFYSEELVQVKLPRWSDGRVVLLGDAAWAPTPFTGEGNQLAIKGAWVLAQEMGREKSPAAFANFERRFRGHVEGAQKIPLWGYAPTVFLPESRWGVWCIQVALKAVAGVVRFVSWSGLGRWLPEQTPDHDFDLEMDEK